MDRWQKDHIRKNLPTLIKDTLCSSSFLTSLYADGIVSNEEVGILRAVSNLQEQAQRFYEIIQTRKDSFNPLKQALKDTSQTGALAILELANPPNVRIPFQSCGSICYIREILLGRGCFGTRVFKGKFENRDVAVKRLNRDEVEMADVKEEINFLTLLDSHKNVVRYFKTEVSDEYIFIALELCDVNLFDWVIQPQKTVEIGVMEVIEQTTEGVAHLHSNRVVHRDLKPSNILLVSLSVGDTQVKISDFGLSKRIPVGVSKLSGHTVGVGTVEWMAPEVAGGLTFQNNVPVGMSYASDLFSLGCIYYFVLSSGLHPFGEASRCQGHILDGKYELNEQHITLTDVNVSEIIKLIRKMIAHERGERPTVFDVITGLREDVMTRQNQKSIIVPTGQQSAVDEEAAKQAGGITPDENSATVGILSTMTDKLRLTKVDEQNTTQITKFRGSVMTTSDMQGAKWEYTKGPNLHLAIRRGDMQAIKELIQLGTDVNAKNTRNEAPLMIAAASKVDGSKTYDIVIYLMERGANVFDTDTEGHTFLHKLFLNSTTFSSGFGPFAQYLVDKRLSSLFNIQDKTSRVTPLMLAARNVEMEMASILLLRNNGVDVSLADKNGASYLSYAAEGSKNGKLLAELQRNGDIKRNNVAEAIQATDVDSVKVLLRLGAPAIAPNDELRTPLHIAALVDKKEFAINIIKFLIHSGADVDAKDKNGYIFLHLLVGVDPSINQTQFDDMAIYLNSKKLSRLFNIPDMNLYTPFLVAVNKIEIQKETMSLLKNNGVDFNAADKAGRSVLYYATVANRTLRMISDLVDLGADPNHLTTPDKWTMLQEAAYYCNVQLAKFFLVKGLDINAPDSNGRTALHWTLLCQRKDNVLETIRFLLRNGANSDIVSKEGKSPRDYFNENRDKYPEADQISASFSLGSSC